jgi:hypothetical protein
MRTYDARASLRPALLIAALVASAPASAAPDTLTWQLEVGGKPAGQRKLTVSTEQTPFGELRTLRAETQLDARALGSTVHFRQNLTANADRGPASFISVIERQGALYEIQGRLAGAGWRLSVTGEGRTRSWEIPNTEVDLSTADLMDPHSRVGLNRFSEVRLLSAETGDVVSGRVEPLGPSTLTVRGRPVAVEGYALITDDARGVFYYTTEGWLVRFESRVFGQEIAGQLVEPPPAGVDDEPVDIFGPGVRSTDL